MLMKTNKTQKADTKISTLLRLSEFSNFHIFSLYGMCDGRMPYACFRVIRIIPMKLEGNNLIVYIRIWRL